ncbi:hypothetical protein RsTz2092_05380 [Deferribacterales bacterium RsTz2092]|nr:hypothetical protein AGMMS49941_00510 [Deferribacterales bacterium]
MREIIFDTETTGYAASTGRIIEIGCVELLNGTLTGNTFQRYLNPERSIHPRALEVHGLTSEFLRDKPKFIDIASELLAFIGDSTLIAHNASFDMGFLNAELARVNLPAIAKERAVDTVALSRKLNTHLAHHNLDALCRAYGIDNSNRTLHGALLDAKLTAEIYIKMKQEIKAGAF